MMTDTMAPYTFPRVDQLHSPTLDGFPDENAGMNCVAAVAAAGLRSITGRVYEPDAVKDAVYGQGYTGGQSAAHYVVYCQKQGVSLREITGAPAGLLAQTAAFVGTRRHVILTIPSHWSQPPADRLHPGASHAVIAFTAPPGRLVAMNPWGGFYQDEPLDWWQARLCYDSAWEMEAAMALDGFDTLGQGFQAWVNDHNITSGRVIQAETYDSSVLPADECFAALDPGDGHTIVLHYKAGSGVDDANGGNLVAKFYQEITSLQAQVASLQAQLAAAGSSGSVEAIALVREIKRALGAVQ